MSKTIHVNPALIAAVLLHSFEKGTTTPEQERQLLEYLGKRTGGAPQ